MPNNVLIDSCFWFALYDKRDNKHIEANVLFEFLINENILIPWPSLYETLNTGFSKRIDYMRGLNTMFSKQNVIRIDDSEYKEKALSKTFEHSIKQKRHLSLVDVVIREMLRDVNLKIHYLLSFNEKDFSDLVYLRNIEFFK